MKTYLSVLQDPHNRNITLKFYPQSKEDKHLGVKMFSGFLQTRGNRCPSPEAQAAAPGPCCVRPAPESWSQHVGSPKLARGKRAKVQLVVLLSFKFYDFNQRIKVNNRSKNYLCVLTYLFIMHSFIYPASINGAPTVCICSSSALPLHHPNSHPPSCLVPDLGISSQTPL